ncbi:glycoside hydrolase family 3 N-terminal domain-containing protein [Microbacterium sp.]|uniref:glycoside hydrolase family 3 N-terminal domain-containing protein n=1 Tax=Microbacterium sp. TaxID=51671 RepID=UPI0039E5B62A
MSVRVDELLARMTWEQKLFQLQIVWRRETGEQHALARRGIGAQFWPPSAAETNALQRVAVEESELGIPLLIALDVVHGQFTIFPTPLAQAASFDPAVAADDARISAQEARGNGVNWTFSPMVDVTRDPRWGRVVEGFGEDVHLAGVLTRAKAIGYQGDDLTRPDALAACLKHFVAYGAGEAGRDYNSADLSRRRLRETYLETFRIGVAAGAASVMAAFTSLNGTPMHAHRGLLTGVLKDEWGFGGVVVGDADGVAQLVDHGVVADEPAAIARAIEAGVDVVMGGTLLVDEDGCALLSPRDVSPERIDDAVRRVLTLKERLGLFENPYVDESAGARAATPERKERARAAAERCLVLLRNEDAALPLSGRRRVLLAGPYARSLDHLGAWVQHFATPVSQTLVDALAAELSDTVVEVADGAGFFDGSQQQLAEAVERARDADVVVLAVGEPSVLSGEASSRADITLPAAQVRLIRAVAATGTPVVVVLATGRPLVIEEWVDDVAAILIAWHLGVEAPAAISGALSGRVNPGGRLPMTFPRAVGQIPIHYDHESTGRPPRTGGRIPTGASGDLAGPDNLDDHYTSKYLDLELGPRYSFGAGLSYTSFTLSALEVTTEIDLDALEAGESVSVSVSVENTGERAGDDVVMLFVRDEIASLTPPVARLRGFRRVALEAGESTRVRFELSADDLRLWTDDERRMLEPGGFSVWVDDGTSRRDGRFTVQERI